MAAQAQQPVRIDTLGLAVLHGDALRRDARTVQLDLLERQTALRLSSLDAERLPALSMLAQGQYQSDVASIPFTLPGVTPASPANDTWDAHLAARQRLYDANPGARRDVERAQLAESQARVRVARYQVRRNVDEAYFTALLLQAQAAEVASAITALEAQLRVATERVDQGAALPSEAAMLEAALLRRRQALDELATGESAAKQVLGALTGRALDRGTALELVDLSDDAAAARISLAALRARPEYEQYTSTREVLDRQQRSVSARNLPRVSAYGRAGYGQPGLNPLGSGFDSYWLTGVQVEWSPWTWGSTGREREVLALQQQVVASEEAAFTDALLRAAATELAGIDRLERALESDDAIIALREQILQETLLRFDEQVITASEYVDRETDVLDARLARIAHRVELARAQARFLTLTGVEIR
jgi:outer membrane protein TolC